MINAQPVCDQGIAKNEMVENNICVENIVHWQPSKPDVSRPPNFSDLSLLSYFLSIIIQFMAENAAIYEIRESFPDLVYGGILCHELDNDRQEI